MKKDLIQNDLRQSLRAAGFKATPTRIHLLQLLQKAKQPLAIQNLMQQVGKSMNQATAYRILKALAKNGLVRQVDFQHGHAHYELASAADHHHLICINCERIEDFTGCDINKITQRVLKLSPQFKAIKTHALELFGVCKPCAIKS